MILYGRQAASHGPRARRRMCTRIVKFWRSTMDVQGNKFRRVESLMGESMRFLAAMVLAVCTALVSTAYFQVGLAPRDLGLPLANFKLSDMLDTFNSARGGERKHEATDIIAPRGTPVLAVDDGNIVKLFWSVPGGRTIYQFDPTERYCYYYAHLDGYEAHLREGLTVHRGQVIGYVGTTGNAPANGPHLHFGITEIGRDKKWWGGSPIDPYPILRSSALKLGIKN
jgi:murein DD-endopeptidase MepM/ murein hydrolase activator NlpD